MHHHHTQPNRLPNFDSPKASINEIRARFDHDVERFSSLETGQAATMDAPYVLDLISDVAAMHNPSPTHLLDLGCGAGNMSLKCIQKVKTTPDVTLVDLSENMLVRAQKRLFEAGISKATLIQNDLVNLTLPANTFDCILAGAVLHHLRTDQDWETVFTLCFNSLKPNGIFLVSDLINHENTIINIQLWTRYRQYLTHLQNEEYAQSVLDYIEKEDTPKSVNFQLSLLQKIGFSDMDLLHKNAVFASYYAIKPS